MLGFLILTLGFGGLAAIMAGRALALIWRSPWQVLAAMMPLTAAIRFLHYALLQDELLSVVAFAIDFGILFILALVGYTATRQWQMRRQYGWIVAGEK